MGRWRGRFGRRRSAEIVVCGNGANFGCNWFHGKRFWDGLGVGLELAKAAERLLVLAPGGIDAALKALQGFVEAMVGQAERAARVGVFLIGDGLKLALPELVLDAAQTAEQPFRRDQDIDQRALLGRDGTVALVVLGGQGCEIFRRLAGEDMGLGVNAGFQGIEAGCRLAGFGARAVDLTALSRFAASCLRLAMPSALHGDVWLPGNSGCK